MLPFRKILAPTDFSQASLAALARAAELAGHFGAELWIAHVVEPVPAMPPDFDYGLDVPNYDPGLYSGAEERLQELVESGLPSGLRVRTLVKYGDAPREVARIAEQEGIDLIVIATHGLTGWRHLVFGSVTEKVVRAACCPVLTLRIPDEKPEAAEAGAAG